MQFERLGPYKIGKRLGRGGMGAVFEGLNIDTREPAAVKVLSPHLADDEGFRERFELEIETLKKLRHPNIVRMYGFGEEGGYLYYAMELVKGHSVEEELQLGRRFTWREVVQHSVKLLKALRHAHDHGVIHRDLKPANLLLADEVNEVKLTDFGIARLWANNHLTMDGALVGTAEYMSPEQAAGDRVTPQSDLYSLGGVMFAMLAGRPPFRTPSLPEMLEKQRFETPPPLSRFVTGVPPELEEFISQLLAKDPKERGANALVLSRQLGAMEHGLSIVRERPKDQPGETQGDAALPSDRTVSDRSSPPATPLPLDPRAPTRTPEGLPTPPDYDPNAATLLAPSVSTADQAQIAAAKSLPAVGDSKRASKGNGAARRQDEIVRAAAPASVSASGTRSESSASRFTTVEEARRRAEQELEPQSKLAIVQIILLASSLAMILGALWYFTRPPSADKLFARIEAAAADNEPGALLSVEDDVQSFLSRFPKDERAAAAKRYEDEIGLRHLEQRFRMRVRLLGRDDTLSPVERDYLEAMNSLGAEPQKTIDKLQAIVDLYGNGSDQSETTQQCVELARRELAQLREQDAKVVPDYRKSVEAELRRAGQLRMTSPEQARAIWRSIVTLYADKPWAADQVQRAKAALGEE
jgi:eukaryotic-like serine/threonine-protein kinase